MQNASRRSKVNRLAVLTSLACLFGASNASADLIASFNLSGSSGSWTATPIGAVYGAGIALYFGTTAQPLSCLGCSPYLSPGVASRLPIEFTRANSPEFDSFVTHLTNTQDETLFTSFDIYGAAGRIGGGSGGNRESQWFTTLLTPDLVASIDFIKLTLNSFSFEPTAYGWQSSYRGTLEIFGAPGQAFEGPYVQPARAVPEPASLGLFSLGLAALALGRRRQPRKL